MNEHTNQTKEPTKGMAIASMVCGICSLAFILVPFVNLILAIVAVALGHVQLSNIKKLPEEFDGRGMAIAGLATGYVTIGIVILGFIGPMDRDISIQKAAKNGGITEVGTVDYSYRIGLFKSTYKTIVTGR